MSGESAEGGPGIAPRAHSPNRSIRRNGVSEGGQARPAGTVAPADACTGAAADCTRYAHPAEAQLARGNSQTRSSRGEARQVGVWWMLRILRDEKHLFCRSADCKCV